MDLIFIDSRLSTEFEDTIFKSILNLFDDKRSVNLVSVFNGEYAWNKLEELKISNHIGSFSVLSTKDLELDFNKWFPNNTIVCDDSLNDEESIRKITKQILWMLNNFGREKKESKMTTNTWVISDTHFWHDNIIKYCDRPYANSEEMNEDLIAKWNASVKQDDIVWHLGDFCFGSKDKIKGIVPRLNGRINLVLGNHDHHKIGFYYECGFNRVYDHPVVISNFFILSHEPMQWVKDGDVYANIFGHVHDQKMYKDFTSNSFCACVERIGYAPIRWTDMVEKMKSWTSSTV